ncbi:MAG: GerAB/ArcD/ProY family transporter [Oscillospiraceae bacterium]
MENKRYIGWGQLLLLLFMCRVFTLMTFVPFEEDGTGLSVQFTAAAVSAAVQAVILIPVVLLKDSAADVLLKKCRPVGIIAAFVYLIFFLLYTVNSLLHFQQFLGERFFKYADISVWIAVILIVCVYCGCLGIEALGRSAVLLFWLFIAAVTAMIFSSAKSFNTANLYFDSVTPDGLFPAVMDDLARNGEICALAFLAKHVKEKLRCGVYGLLASKLLLAEAAILTIAAVLGDFAALTDYPFLVLGTLGGARFIQRSDSLYLIVWTVTAVINIALFLHISAGLLEEVFPKLKFRTAIAAVIVFAATMFFTLTSASFSGIFAVLCSGWTVIILTGAIPLAALIISKRKVAEKKHE